MSSYESRLVRLERRLSPTRTQESFEMPTPQRLQEIEEFGARLRAKIAEDAAENARRKLLPLEEQIQLLEADRESRREEHAKLPPKHSEIFDRIHAFGEAIAKQMLADLKEQLANQRRHGDKGETLG